ncbi:pre-rRNA 2'-O-ribose RNA methyltransferase FTSJ3 [Dissostichus eleginoides]|uniref:pre-rRNA processing protein FTSJ3 n=1 Tax=Dissostichus eleginoides TaxID=100907 RepID=A0AAD9C791_DISEL|nr:pre-rRNA 2'-O-ribose RNA methyltransferase FTSJ3 [Dissostichus eleginoides]
MGKKLKVGKTRKDKFYHLAKETGYRSRSSFKLIQLNRKFQFLQKARAVVDLCAAPGGWLQVASKFMPISSIIIGVDLVPIKSIPNVVTLQEDITTDKCRQAIKKELQTWKVDVVLNDGAPNVGANWQHDAFTQAHLTLMAMKLACEFLTKGGTFVTKVFRSKDYQPLLWIFQQFFKKVQATKPQASRNESAEIFVICQGYLAPDKIDARFFDPKHAFKEVEEQAKTVRDLIPVKKAKAEGYEDGDLTLYHTFTVTTFLKADNAIDFLSKANEIIFDNPDLESHPSTTIEIKECLRDIKVLGRKELRLLLTWRSTLRKYLAKKLKGDSKPLDPDINLSSDEEKPDFDEEEEKKNKKKKKKKQPEEKEEKEGEDDEEEEDEEEMETKLAEMKAEEVAELKRKKRKLLKERRKLRERVELKMDLPGVSIADSHDFSMFSISTIKKQKTLADISKGDMQLADTLGDEDDDLHLSDMEGDDADEISLASDLDDEDMEEVEQKQRELAPKKKKVKFDEEKELEGQDSALLVELEGKDEKKERETNLWFSKGIFSEINLEGDAESELRQTEWLQKKKTSKKRKAEDEDVAEGRKRRLDSDDSSDDEKEINKMKQVTRGAGGTSAGTSVEANEEDFQVVPVESISKKHRILDAEGLALGSMIATSKKFASSEQQWDVPEWFLVDEKKHRKKPTPVTREMVEEFKQKWKEIDARPIKRVAEAKARKKRRMLKKMDQTKKKAEAVCNTIDISEREKNAQLKSIYKKAGMGKEKRELTYIVSKKGAGKKVRRPAGVKGAFKVVDGRMKKDMRGMQRKEQRANGGKGKGGKGKGGPRGGGMKGGKGRKGR